MHEDIYIRGCKTARMTDLRSELIALLDHYMEETGLDLSGLARISALAETTLTRFYNSKDHTSVLTTRTLNKLSDGIAKHIQESGAVSGTMSRPKFAKFVKDPDVLALIGFWELLDEPHKRLYIQALADEVRAFLKPSAK